MTAGVVPSATLGVTAIPRTAPPTRAVRGGALPVSAVCHATVTVGVMRHATLGVTAIPRTAPPTRAVRGGALPVSAACHATVTVGVMRHATLGVAAIPRTAPPTRAVRGGALPVSAERRGLVAVSAVRRSRTRAVCRGRPLIAARAVFPGHPLAAVHTPVAAISPSRRLMARVRARVPREERVAVLLLGSVGHVRRGHRRLLRPALGRYPGGVRA
ncbi:hypothetical protein ACFZCU_04140 [Streptomyces canus]|uniref:hypothetical protein n=1 Tax=Streptomyces canus TaxID=58343 RepID=UPI0036EB18AA